MSGLQIKKQYRCTQVTTADYGDGPNAGAVAIAHLAALPDGQHWQLVPATIDIRVPPGTRPGAIFDITIEERR